MALHVVPDHDLIEHQLRDDCPCGPAVEVVRRPDGAIGRLITHHLIDNDDDPFEGGEPDAVADGQP